MTEILDGRYRIAQKLGEGGMGVVFAGHDDRLGRPVAVKMIRQATSSAASRERLWREARAAAAVSHPNVCQLFEIGETQGQLFITMELLEGESLATRLARGPIALGECVPIALAVLSALAAIHLSGIVHRDLKPSNVFLTPRAVKLLDFGLARAVDDDPLGVGETRTGLTLAGTVVGTPRYMSPEQAMSRPLNARSDLFAAAIVIYEMLTGSPPFGGHNPVQVMHAVMYEELPALAGSAAVAAVDRVLHRAMAKNPDDRYPSADAMALAFALGDDARVLEIAERMYPGYGYVGQIALAAVGRDAEAIAAARKMEATALPRLRALIIGARHLIEGNQSESAKAIEEAVAGAPDPELMSHAARMFARLGEPRRAFEELSRASEAGYCSYPQAIRDPWLSSLRGKTAFDTLVGRLREQYESNATAFSAAGGPAILGAAEPAFEDI